jgi:hypothetical protein
VKLLSYTLYKEPLSAADTFLQSTKAKNNVIPVNMAAIGHAYAYLLFTLIMKTVRFSLLSRMAFRVRKGIPISHTEREDHEKNSENESEAPNPPDEDNSTRARVKEQ